MKRILFIIFCFTALRATAQNIVYNDTFVQSRTYTSGSTQWDNWTTFRASLDTTVNKFLKVTMKGTYDMTGRSCTDPTLTRRIAAMLKSGSGSVSCGGYTWQAGTVGSGIEFSADGTLNTCLNNGYSVRPQIGNANWGGVNVYTCNNSSQRLIVIFEKPTKPNDAGISSIATPLCVPTVKVTLNNFGTNTIDSVKINWSVNGVLQSPTIRYNTSMAKQTSASVTLTTTYPFVDGTTYSIKAWTTKPNNSTDSVASNDTARISFKYIEGAKTPSTSNVIQCGVGFATLKATPVSQFDSINWYTSPSGGIPFARGRSVKSPFLQYGVKTFYAEALKSSTGNARNSFNSGGILTANTGYYNGGAFNITPSANMSIDSLVIRLWQYTPNTTYSVYYKTGPYSGFETNSGAWTPLVVNASSRVVSGSQGNLAYMKIPATMLTQGTVYGFYVTTTNTIGNDLFLRSGNDAFSNSDISVNYGSLIYGNGGPFGSGGSYITNYTIDLQVFYTKQLCPSSRQAMTVTVNPSPTGSDIITGPSFKDHAKTGTGSDPDISSKGKTVEYELTPPRGYSNSDYLVKWKIQSAQLITKGGYVIPAGEYTLTPATGSTNNKLSFVPTSKYVDSTITVYYKVADLGPYFCDTAIVRNLYIAPTPHPNFKFPAVNCVGAPVLFDNISDISKGQMTYMWYFGDGDSTDAVGPVHNFPGEGSYNVRLVATSVKFNIIKDTTIKVVIASIPKLSFKAANACEGRATQFVNSSTITTGSINYDWNFGDNTAHSALTNPTHNYSVPGTYKVTLKGTSDKGCVAELTKNSYLFPRPKPGFVAPSSSICSGAPINFPNTSTILSGEMGGKWTFGDGVVQLATNGEHAYAAAGTYNVKLKMQSEFGCEDSITKSVNILPSPVVNFSTDRACSNEPTVFTNMTSPLNQSTYTWTFSDGAVVSTTNVVHNWSAIGPKTITLKALQGNGCTGNVTKTIEVLPQPKAKFTVADICSGEEAIFENQTTVDQGEYTNKWDFGDNNTSTVSDPEYVYNVTTTKTFNVMLITDIAGGCSDTAVETITVSELPKCDFTTQVNWVNGYRSIKFIPGNTSYTEYRWLFGDGGSATGTSPVYQFQGDGNYKVKLIATNAAGCKCETIVSVNVARNLGTADVEADAVNIYPNPNNGSFIVELGDDAAGSEIEVYNTVGERVYFTVSDGDDTPIDLGNAAKGIYIVKIKTNGKTSTRKVSVN